MLGARAAAVASSAVLLLGYASLRAQVLVDVETGLAFSGYNDVRIPNDSGTKFSLSGELETDPAVFIRVSVSYPVGDRHTIAALIAPLRLEAAGALEREVHFEGEEFSANAPLQALYRFDSYRLSYRYDFSRSERLRAGAGVTVKIRDASIRLEGGGRESEKKNTGFVPLLNFRLLWHLGQDFEITVDGDALAGPQGRAEDVLLAVRYWPTKKTALKLGYRILEGGADVDEVYNFALVNYLVVGSLLTF